MKKRFLFLAVPMLVAMPFTSCVELDDENEDDGETPNEDQVPGDVVSNGCKEMCTTFGNTNGQEYVDLGLPSGNLWAKMNVGATSVEDYGDLYAWGATEKQDKWSVHNYIFSNEDGSNTYNYTKYVPKGQADELGYNGFYDDKTILVLTDDVAHTTMGGSWRMPTDCDWSELLDNCQGSWSTYQGVNGWKFIAKNGEWIFLPAAGEDFGQGRQFGDESGEYWASTLDSKYSEYAYGNRIYFEETFECKVINASRDHGYSIRGVCPVKK